jgi:cytochrome b6-f complex iron-sulfur subunit
MSESALPGRRYFLHVLGAGGVGAMGLCGLAACSGSGGGATRQIDAGNVADVPVGTVSVVSGASVAIAHDEGGLYAMTLICPHDNCDMEVDGTVSADSIVCTCHGSEFDGNGAVLKGPANTPLEHYEVTVDSAGAITINADKVVDASTRTAVPASA